MNNFQKQLACPWVEDEDSSIDRFGCQITLKSFMDSDSIDISIINKPDRLIGE